MRKILILLLLFNIFSFNEIILGGNDPLYYTVTGDTLYYNDFENGLDDWTPVNLANPGAPTLWHITSSMFVSPGHSAAWNDSAAGSYPHNLNEALVSPPFTVPSNAKIYFNFDVFVHLTPHGISPSDLFDVQISTNGGTSWSFFTNYSYSGQQIGWKSFPVDFSGEPGELTSYAGQTVMLRFVVTSDNFDPNGNGVYIDNVRITKVECDLIDPYEPNNILSNAAPITYASTIVASLCPEGDIDFYSFPAQQGDRVTVESNIPIFKGQVALLSANGTLLASHWNQIFYQINNAGTYYIRITSSSGYPLNYIFNLNAINTKPDVLTVTDIPDDNGLQVRVKWQYSFFDPPTSIGEIKAYHLFRKADDSASGNKVFYDEKEFINSSSKDGSIFFLENEFWDYIASIPAVSNRPFNNYTYTAPTLRDSLLSTFVVAAENKDPAKPVLWGLPGSGFSIDNIPPEFAFLNLTPSGNEFKLQWNINTAVHPDVINFKVYRGMFERFAPGVETIIANLSSSETSYIDNDVTPGINYYYLVSATDNSGNTTMSSPLEGVITSAGNENINTPASFMLLQNYPNPFNPVTKIKFHIPASSFVSLKIYDLLGNEIATLVNEQKSSGIYEAEFNSSSIGKGLPSGVYFYTLKAGAFTDTKKLLLMK
jgi:hypothetical protein